MKQSTKKLLVWLYPVDGNNRWVDYEELRLLLPKITVSGRKSLVSYLQQKNQLVTERIRGRLKLALTSSSIALLKEEFPAFLLNSEQWDGQWSLICFLQASATDKNFRYLRTKLLRYKCIPLSRGVFLYAGQLPALLLDTFTKLYANNVMVFKTKDFVFGNDKIVIGQKINLTDCLELYSSISRELSELLVKKTTDNCFTDRQKTQFFSLFSRLIDALESDHGLVKHFFPDESDGQDLLSQMQSVFHL